jgi:hypothetical protein
MRDENDFGDHSIAAQSGDIQNTDWDLYLDSTDGSTVSQPFDTIHNKLKVVEETVTSLQTQKRSLETDGMMANQSLIGLIKSQAKLQRQKNAFCSLKRSEVCSSLS